MLSFEVMKNRIASELKSGLESSGLYFIAECFNAFEFSGSCQIDSFLLQDFIKTLGKLKWKFGFGNPELTPHSLRWKPQ